MGSPVEMSATDALKAFAKSGITVKVPELTKKGQVVKDAEGRVKVIEQPLAGEHILSAKDLGDAVRIVTVDGARYEAPKGAK